MPLTCYCSDDLGSEPVYWTPAGYSIMPWKPRRRRCSCGAQIQPGAMVAKFDRSRAARTDIEERICGDGYDAIPLAAKYLCERCADLYFSLTELGFECVGPDESMLDLVKEYSAIARENAEHRASDREKATP